MPQTLTAATDPDFLRVVNAHEQLGLCLEKSISSRGTTIGFLCAIAKSIEKSYNDSRIAKCAGASASIVGSALGITGVILIPFTFGGSLALSIVGGVLGTTGGIVTAGAEIGYYIISKDQLKCANEALAVDRENMKMLKALGDDFESQMKSLIEKYKKNGRISELWKVSKIIGSGMYKCYKLFDGIFDAAKAVQAAYTGAKVAGVAARTTFRCIGAIADAVSLPFDIIVLVKSSIDIDKYKKTGKSNSSRANQILDFITLLERQKSELIAKRDELI